MAIFLTQRERFLSILVSIYTNNDFERDHSKPTTTVYVITPTHKRLTQKADLTSMAQTLKDVENLHWIVVEDDVITSSLVVDVVHRNVKQSTVIPAFDTMEEMVTFRKDKSNSGKGFMGRNKALKLLEEMLTGKSPSRPQSGPPVGVLYFADDDNRYDVRIFEQMRKIQKIGIAPVALAGGVFLEKPAIIKTKDSINGMESWFGHANHLRFQIDMAGIAINVGFWLRHRVYFPVKHVNGPEHHLLSNFNVTMAELEPFGTAVTPGGLKEVLVWHTKTKVPDTSNESNFKSIYGNYSHVGWEV